MSNDLMEPKTTSGLQECPNDQDDPFLIWPQFTPSSWGHDVYYPQTCPTCGRAQHFDGPDVLFVSKIGDPVARYEIRCVSCACCLAKLSVNARRIK